jgi:hypothetical protein
VRGVLGVTAAALLCAGCTCLLLAACASPPVDDPAAVRLHLQLRLDAAFNPSSTGDARPSSTPVRYALPDGWGYFMMLCMHEAGFEQYDFERERGFTNGGLRANRTGAEGLAWYECTRRLPQPNVVYARLDAERIDELYDYYTGYLVPCLEAQGVQLAEAPSRAAFADGGEGQAGWWNPFLSVVTPASTGVVDLLFEKCAPYPLAAGS